MTRKYINPTEIWVKGDGSINNDNAFFGSDGLNKVLYSTRMDPSGYFVHQFTGDIVRIDEEAFKGSIMTEIILPDTVVNIGDKCFADCEYLRNVQLPSDLRYIGISAFENCVSIQEIVFEPLLQSIDNYAFRGCGGLLQIISKPTIAPILGTDVFEDIPAIGHCYYPQTSDYSLWRSQLDEYSWEYYDYEYEDVDAYWVKADVSYLYFYYDGTPYTSNVVNVEFYGEGSEYLSGGSTNSEMLNRTGKKTATNDKSYVWTYTYTVTENPSTEERLGIEYYVHKLPDGTTQHTSVFIVQDANPNGVPPTEIGEVEVNPFVTILKFDADGKNSMNYDSFTIGYKNTETEEYPTSTQTWFRIINSETEESNYYDKAIVYYFVIEPNETTTARTAYVSQRVIGLDGSVTTITITVNQAGKVVEPDEPETPEVPENSSATTIAPIWQDTVYEFVGESAEYELYVEEREFFVGQWYTTDKLIYKAKVHSAPNTDIIPVTINKICQNYFKPTYMDLDILIDSDTQRKIFKLKGIGGNILHTYIFINDWSYKPLTLGLKTNPIIPYIGNGQRLFFSAFATDAKNFYYGMTYYNGEETYTNGLTVINRFETLFVPESRSKYVQSFIVGDNEYPMIDRCKCKYVIYYVNPNGGWDWFPILGKVVKTDSVKQYTYTQNYNNNTLQFGKNRYLSEIATKMTMNTAYLTEKQSDRMWELLESNYVYVHSLEDDKIIPVIITNTDIEYKRKGIRNKLISYDITVEFSQTRERL